MDWIPYGPHAALLRFGDRPREETFRRCQSILNELDRSPPVGLAEVVPGFTSLLLEFDSHQSVDLAAAMTAIVARLNRTPARAPASPVKQIPVVYDGLDLERVAKHARLSVQEVCRRHAQPIYKVYLLGFAPGFPYLGELDPQLHTPRLNTPRTRVPAGSVAIGGQHTGIYSVAGPGGWNIIGRTDLPLFDPAKFRVGSLRTEAFFLKPGDLVKFVAS